MEPIKHSVQNGVASRGGREFSVRLQGGEVIRLLLDEPDLAAVSERLRYERALIGQIVFDDDGCLETAAALIPGHRIQLVVDPHG